MLVAPLFATTQNLQTMKSCEQWFCDGTFSVTPPLFSQLYTVHGLLHGKVIPLVYALLPNKTAHIYRLTLNALKELQSDLNPKQIMIDFEVGFITACKKVFPKAEIKGCHFHYAQSIWRNIQAHGLQKAYRRDENCAHHLKMLISISFVPEKTVYTVYTALQQTPYFTDNTETLESLLEYYEET